MKRTSLFIVCLLPALFLWGSCMNSTTPMYSFVTGTIQDMHQDENGFLTMNLKIKKDSTLLSVTAIKYVERFSKITDSLEVGEQIAVKEVINCPIGWESIFKTTHKPCFIEVLEFKYPEKDS